jgi:RNA polymerase sigma-70 factor (ECF subfamily)
VTSLQRPEEQADSDEQLAAAAREGESRAFERLLLRHESPVLALLRSLGVPRADREDVAQEIFVRLFRHLGRYRPTQPFRPWLYRVAVNACHDYRHRSRRQRSEQQGSEALLLEASDASPGPSERLRDAENRSLLESALESLSERERAVFVLCEMEEMRTREVAKALRISAITVWRHLGRARRRLQEILSSH